MERQAVGTVRRPRWRAAGELNSRHSTNLTEYTEIPGRDATGPVGTAGTPRVDEGDGFERPGLPRRPHPGGTHPYLSDDAPALARVATFVARGPRGHW
jgi:hypothetical protein